MKRFNRHECIFLLSVVLVVGFATAGLGQQKRPLTFVDVMKFRTIRNVAVSEDGRWVAYDAVPDRGDPQTLVQFTGGTVQYTIGRGSKPQISRDGNWLATFLRPPATDLLRKKKDKPASGMVLLNLTTGQTDTFKNVEAFRFSNDSRWIVLKHAAPKKKGSSAGKKRKIPTGTRLLLRNLASGEETEFPFVTEFSLDSLATVLVYAVSDTSGKENGLYFVELKQKSLSSRPIMKKAKGFFSGLSWNPAAGHLVFLAGTYEDNGFPAEVQLYEWDFRSRKTDLLLGRKQLPGGWVIYHKNKLRWSRDGKRLFLGLKPEKEIVKPPAAEEEEPEQIDLYDVDAILKDRGVDVWHWNDPLIIPNQKKMWKRIKDRTYTAVFHLRKKKLVPLCDEDMPDLRIPENPDVALGVSNVPYLKLITWYGRLYDYYLVDLNTGKRRKIIEKAGRSAYLSPGGKYVVYYRDRNWHLIDTGTGKEKNLTADLNVPFHNEDHDYPYPPPGYGIAGWTKKDAHVLIYDKYDIWQFPTRGGDPMRLTDGRERHLSFRIVRLSRERRWFEPGEEVLLTGTHTLEKYRGFYTATIGRPGVTERIVEKKKFTFIAKAKKADILIFIRESFDEFPDLWVSQTDFRTRKKLSNVNPQQKDFLWGKAELVEWLSADGIPLQGVVIKPENYEPGKRYPVLVYFYRIMSNRLYNFPQMAINHRPCLPLYTSNGYVVFLPDVKFQVGRPGFSSTKCLVPGVQKLIEMGIADPKAIALHGHSWGGYQTAFVITQTDIFACAIAGAPVANMTSAYGGIRWGSGLARQFQYEQTQSRIGGSLWEYPERYIENSPLFFADRINTPLLIMHGDEDDAVPWYQSIELYLAMRRLGKECYFLQYRKEPHHPRKYANKLDYAIRMKQFFDHYCKGAPAPEWMIKGVPYRGR